LLGLGLASAANAQLPDVAIKLVGYLNIREGRHRTSGLEGYDALGHFSTIGLLVTTEPGLKVYVTEKLKQIPHDGDPNTLDEAYVEGEGSWRLGKQYLPFGNGMFLRESVLAVRSDADLQILDLPMSVAGCDGGSGRQRGVVVRIGGNIGASLAIGRRFGINATDFDLVRRPDEAPGPNRGFRAIGGLDFTQKDKAYTFRGELVRTQNGETSLDLTDTLWDLSVEYRPSRFATFTLGTTHSALLRADFVRLAAAIRLTQNLFFEPMVRSKNGVFYDLNLGLHVKF
jgi:hypothetical protein